MGEEINRRELEFLDEVFNEEWFVDRFFEEFFIFWLYLFCIFGLEVLVVFLFFNLVLYVIEVIELFLLVKFLLGFMFLLELEDCFDLFVFVLWLFDLLFFIGDDFVLFDCCGFLFFVWVFCLIWVVI